MSVSFLSFRRQGNDINPFNLFTKSDTVSDTHVFAQTFSSNFDMLGLALRETVSGSANDFGQWLPYALLVTTYYYVQHEHRDAHLLCGVHDAGDCGVGDSVQGVAAHGRPGHGRCVQIRDRDRGGGVAEWLPGFGGVVGGCEEDDELKLAYGQRAKEEDYRLRGAGE